MSDLATSTNNLMAAWFKPSNGFGPTNDFNQEDFGLPWLRIAQRTTKAITKGATEYIKGLEAGMFFNSITSEVYGEKLKVSVIKFQRTYKEVTDTENPEYIGPLTEKQYNENLSAYGNDYKKARTPAGNKQKEQFNYFVILPEHLGAGMLRMAISPGGFSACKAWNTQLATLQPGYMYAGIWELTLQYNDGDNPFYTIGVGSKPSAVKVGFVSGEVQAFAEAATMSIHENLGKILNQKVEDDTPF